MSGGGAVAELAIPAFYINLDRRTDRRQECEQELAKAGIAAVRVPAVYGQDVLTADDLLFHRRRRGRPGPGGAHNCEFRSPTGIAGMVGCVLSHQRMLAAAQVAADRDDAPAVLCMEDDVVFTDDLRARWPGVVANAPAGWKLLLLGGMPIRRHHWVAPGVVASPGGAYCAHAYVVARPAIAELAALLADRSAEADVLWTPLFEQGRAFLAWPHVAEQRKSYSDIAGITVDKYRPGRTWKEPK